MTAPCGAALSRHPITATATGEVAGALLEAVGTGAAQVLVFATPHHGGALEDVVTALRSILAPGAVATSTSPVVIGAGEAVDDGPGLAAFAAHQPTGAALAVEVAGCRPIGDPMVVTEVDGDLVAGLASEPALAVLRRTIDSLPGHDRALAARGLHLGVVRDEGRASFGPADFDVRAIRGSVGGRSLAVDAEVAVGTTVQFLVADPATARSELRRAVAGRGATGAVLRTTAERGDPHREAALLADLVGTAVAGAREDGPGAAASVLLFGTPG